MNTHYSILIVEDNHAIRKLYEWVLQNEGYSVTGAATVAECDEYLKENIPDLILMDNALPDGSGLAVLKRISMNRDFDSAFKLLISGEKTSEEDRMMGLDAGALDYMLKPIREDDLISRVRMIFKIHEVEEKRRETEQMLNLELLEKNQSLNAYQKKLEQSEEKYRNIFENSAIGIFRSTPEGRYEFVNPAFAKIVGYESPEKMVNEIEDISSLYEDPVDREKIKMAFDKYGYVENYEIKAKTTSGEVVWMSVNAKQISSADGKTYYEGTIQDITKRKLAEIELHRQKEIMQSIINLLPVMITRYDPQNNILLLNKEFQKLTGYTTEDAADKNFIENVYPDPDYRSSVIAYMERAGNEWKQFNVTGKNGEIITSEWSNIRLNDGTQIGIGIDVREKLKATKELKESELKHRLLFENSAAGIGYYTVKGELISFNTVAAKLMGGEPEDFAGKSLVEMYGENLGSRIIERINKAAKTDETLIFEDKTELPAGEFWFLSYYKRIIDTENNIYGIQIIANDISRLKITEQELRKSEERFKIASQLSSDYAYSYSIDPKGNFTFEWVTGNFEKITGYTIEESEARGGWQKLFHPDDLEIVKKRGTKLLAGENDISEFRIINKDGSVRWVREYGMPIWDDSEKRVVQLYGASLDITAGKKAEIELREKYLELDRFNKVLIGRENRMIELKREINELCNKLKLPKKYSAPDEIV